jgi:hypothetical protein
MDLRVFEDAEVLAAAVPASILHRHGNCIVLADRSAVPR